MLTCFIEWNTLHNSERRIEFEKKTADYSKIRKTRGWLMRLPQTAPQPIRPALLGLGQVRLDFPDLAFTPPYSSPIVAETCRPQLVQAASYPRRDDFRQTPPSFPH